MPTGHDNISAPSGVYEALAASDVNDCPEMRSLYIGTGGDLVVMGYGDDTEVTFANVPAGIFDIRPRRIMESSTAADIVALK